MQIKKVILVFKTHFDIGFTKLSREVLDDYAGEMLDRVAETCDATRDMGALNYVWTMPAWPLKTMRDRADEAHAKKVDELIARNQLAWHALPYTSHYDFCGVEDALWGLKNAKELSERYHLPLKRAAKMTDVPGHGRFLAEMLADAGVRLLHLGCNEFAMPPSLPEIFWWEAPSGKRVLTMYNSGYGTGLFPPENWRFDTWMALMNTNDNSGPQSAEIVKSDYERLHARFPEAEIVCGTLDDMWNALKNEDLSDLPIVKSDLADTWIHGAASYPRESAQIRRLRARLNRVQRAWLSHPDDPELEKAVARAYDAMALYAEHTWGLDVKTWLGAIPDYEAFDEYRKTSEKCARMEKSWREQIERAEKATAACEEAEKRLGIRLPAEFKFEGGETLSGEQTLSGARYALRFSADTGRIHALTDLVRGCELLSERGETSVFSYRYDRFGADDMTEYLRAYAHRFSDWGIFDNGRINYPECAHAVRVPEFVSCRRNDRTVQFVYRASEGERLGDAETVNLYVTVPETDAPVRVRVELKGKKATPYIESGALCMPLGAENPAYFINKTGSVLRPETDIARNANHAFYALEHFAAASDDRAMIAIVSHDAPLVSLGENGVHKFRAEYEPHAPEMRFCLFNNMWGTNFPQWIEGDMAFEFDVFSENANAVDSAYARACALAANPNGEAPIEIPFALSEGLRLTGVYPEKNGVLLHIQNLKSAAQSGTICAQGWTFEEEDLLGRKLGGEWKNAVSTEFAPYDLRAFRAKRI